MAKLEAQVLAMVPRLDLEEARREAAEYKADAHETHVKLEAALQSIASLQETISTLRAELEALNPKP